MPQADHPTRAREQISQIEIVLLPDLEKQPGWSGGGKTKRTGREGKGHSLKKQIYFLPLSLASKMVYWVEWWFPKRHAYLKPVNVTLFRKRVFADEIK